MESPTIQNNGESLKSIDYNLLGAKPKTKSEKIISSSSNSLSSRLNNAVIVSSESPSSSSNSSTDERRYEFSEVKIYMQDEIEENEQEQDDGLVECNVCRCKFALEFLDLHESQCRIDKVRCFYCDQFFSELQLVAHQKECKKIYLIDCPICREYVHIATLDTHGSICKKSYPAPAPRQMKGVQCEFPDQFFDAPDRSLPMQKANRQRVNLTDNEFTNSWSSIDPYKNSDSDITRFQNHCMHCEAEITNINMLNRHEASCARNPNGKNFVYSDKKVSISKSAIVRCEFCKTLWEEDKMVFHQEACPNNPAVDSEKVTAWQKMWIKPQVRQEYEEPYWDQETEIGSASANMAGWPGQFADAPENVAEELRDLPLPCQFCCNTFKAGVLYEHEMHCTDNPSGTYASSGAK